MDGAEQIPFLISWNITKRCNLKCAHCYLDSSELEGRDDTTTEEALRFIDEMASVNPHAMLILTGGEPLLRKDWGLFSRYATDKGLTVVMGTNGTLLDDAIVDELIKCGVMGVGISLDSAAPDYHDRFRGVSGAWKRTLAGIDALNRRGLDFQVQLSVTRENRFDLPGIIAFAAEKGARAVNVFFLVCTGRGQNMTDLSPEEYEAALDYLVKAEKEYEDRILVRARCAPHVLRVASKLNQESRLLRGGTSGCIAGRGYLRISPEGCVTPCPYMPAADRRANLKNTGLVEILRDNVLFRSLKCAEYNGRCKECEFNDICGGCRARALAHGGDIMGEDPWCVYEPAGGALKKAAVEAAGCQPVWNELAKERLSKIPRFLRGMVVNGVERYARSKGLSEITPQVMSELKKRAGK